MKKISYISLANIRNGEHFDFHEYILTILTEALATLLGFAPLRAAYAAHVATLGLTAKVDAHSGRGRHGQWWRRNAHSHARPGRRRGSGGINTRSARKSTN